MRETLGDLVTALQQAVNMAAEQLRRQQLKLLSEYFTEENLPVYVPLRLPQISPVTGQLEHSEVQVPKLSLVPMGALAIDEVQFDFYVHLRNVKKELAEQEAAQVLVELPGMLSSQKDMARVQIKFKGGEPPEAVLKLNDIFLKVIP